MLPIIIQCYLDKVATFVVAIKIFLFEVAVATFPGRPTFILLGLHFGRIWWPIV